MEPVALLKPIQPILPHVIAPRLESLPIDIIAIIFSFLSDNSSVKHVLRTCKRFKQIVLNDQRLKKECVERQFLNAKEHCHFSLILTQTVRRFQAADSFFNKENPFQDLAYEQLDNFSKRIHKAEALYEESQKDRILLHGVQVVGCSFLLCCQWGVVCAIASMYNSIVNHRLEGPIVCPDDNDTTDYLAPDP